MQVETQLDFGKLGHRVYIRGGTGWRGQLQKEQNKMSGQNKLLLAGDIGGTKTVLALYGPEVGPDRPVAKATFPSREYRSLEVIVSKFLEAQGATVARASFGIAGPVVNGRVRTTNLPWVLEENQMAGWLGSPVHLLNDLAAIAYAVPQLSPADTETLNAGSPAHRGPLAVVAPGTGLGEAFLLWVRGGYQAFASEGGHADFAPNTPLEDELLRYLRARLGHVSYEQVCSGRGIPHLYAFLKETEHHPEPDWLRAELARVSDPTPVIVRAGVDGKAEICVAALGLFANILAAEAGNLALKVLASGGVYLGGGIPPRILGFLRQESFLHTVAEKGRFSELMKRVPVHVILNPEVALFGAACYGLDQQERSE